ncbi:hypothetical protein SAMN04487996_1205 [Dyadobacter soli]|uniref:PLOD1-3-like GT domain-containing protein n=1 Tax=Dyadobacter soli TaxID=659014 RepID=A0A1G7V9N8_9BACT|nr:glycosyltransferase domain-containing protein [Dyadobacter soli]SDG56288.1 hypothetical protein SAMN04487996_1205 [Dyadobacter soli]
MIVITCVTNKDHAGYAKGLAESCRYFGYQLECLEHDGTWPGHRQKDLSLCKFLQAVPSNEIVLFTDGYDTVFVTSEAEIIEKFSSRDVPVLFSAEINCFPYSAFSYLHKPCPSKFRYLNSGGFIGRAGDILDLYQRFDAIEDSHRYLVDNNLRWSNQYRWMKMFLFTEGLIGLDTNCEIFQVFGTDLSVYDKIRKAPSEQEKSMLRQNEICRILDDFVIGDRIFNKQTGSHPCHLHFASHLLKNHMFSQELAPCLPWTHSNLLSERSVPGQNA